MIYSHSRGGSTVLEISLTVHVRTARFISSTVLPPREWLYNLLVPKILAKLQRGNVQRGRQIQVG